ncbi:putative ankyrin repeat protein RF_0381 [Zophobas morio]|uniref:putative ankyrin repeat protein RF_0381 n=1 Tax=Zophobas morio TaxID=2755281 RepID=UPI0030828FD2
MSTSKAIANVLLYTTHCTSTDNGELINLLLTKSIDINSQTLKGETVLHEACQFGEFDYAKKFLENGAQVNMVDDKGNTALHHVFDSPFLCDDADGTLLVKLLIENGVDVNAQNRTGITALHLACRSGIGKIAEVLVENNANVDAKDAMDETALHYALRSKQNCVDTCKLLIAKSVDVDAPNKHGITPLKLAIQLGFTVVTELLTAKCSTSFEHSLHELSNDSVILEEIENVNVEDQDIHGSTVLQRVCRDNGDVKMVKQLLKRGAKVNTVDNEDSNALHYALNSETENIELLTLLLEHIDYIDDEDWIGMTPLHVACKNGKFLSAKLLLKYGAGVNITDISYRNALHHALSDKNQNKELIALLVSEGADVNAQNIEGVTRLHHACEYNNYATAKVLLDNEARIDILDSKYQNALHYALLNEGSHKDIIDLLAQSGVDVNGKDENGTTPIHRAGAKGDITDLELILKNRGELTLLDNKGRNVLHYAASRCTEDVPVVLFLIRNGLSINSRDKNKKTPLHKACHCGNFLVAETLLKEGAQLDSVDINNENALHYAASNIFNPFDTIKIMRLLLERGININAQNNEGATPDINNENALHYAASNIFNPFDTIKIMRLLLERGININAQNNEGATPLHLACKYVNEEFVEELLKNGVDVDVFDNNKENALHYAMKTATEESFVEVLLLDFNIDINAQNKQGTTALHLACQRGILGCVAILLENGADVNIRDNDNKNALCYVSNTSKDKLKIINLLIQSGIDRDDED